MDAPRKLFGIATLLAALLMLVSGCVWVPQVQGPEDLVIAFGDPQEWTQVDSLVRAALERTISTPHREKIFRVHFYPADSLGRYNHYRHLLFVGSLKAEGKAGEYVNKLVGQNRQRVLADSAFVFSKRDPWVKKQLLVVFTAKDLPTLKKRLRENQDLLFDLFNDFVNEQVKKRMFATLEQKDIEKHLLEKYGWMVRVQHDYFIALEKPNFVFLRRTSPKRERWLFVLWEHTNDPARLSKEWVLEKRKEVGEKYYGGDRILDLDLTVKETNFNGRYALQFDGIWENPTKIAGGPWRAYAFYDEPTGNLYLIDLAVFAPDDEKKMPFLRQLDVMAHTFRTKYELEKQDKRK